MYACFALWFGDLSNYSSDYRSLEHPVTMTVTVVNECQEAFGFDTVRRQIMKRNINFLVKISKNINSVGAAVATKYTVDE